MWNQVVLVNAPMSIRLANRVYRYADVRLQTPSGRNGANYNARYGRSIFNNVSRAFRRGRIWPAAGDVA